MTFQFVRLNDDGGIASAIPGTYTTRMSAEAAAPRLLISRRGHGGRLALVQIVAAVDIVAQVSYETWPLKSK